MRQGQSALFEVPEEVLTRVRLTLRSGMAIEHIANDYAWFPSRRRRVIRIEGRSAAYYAEPPNHC